MGSAEWAKNCPRREGIKLNYHLNRLHFGDEQTPQARRGFFYNSGCGYEESSTHSWRLNLVFAIRLQLVWKKRTWEKKEDEECRRVRQTLGRGGSLYLFLPSRILKMPGISGLPEIAAEQWGRKEEAGLLQFLGFFVARGRHFCDALFFPFKKL